MSAHTTVKSEGYAALSDEVLVKEYQAGDGQAFAVLYERYAGQMTGYFRNRIPDQPHADHQDLAHEVFVLALAELGAWRGDGRDDSFRRWLFGGLARHVLWLEFKKRTCRRRVWLEEVASWQREQDHAAAAADPATHSAGAVVGGELGRRLAALSPRRRRVVELRCLEGQSLDATAQIMGLRKNAVVSALYYALQRLSFQGEPGRAVRSRADTIAQVLEAGRQVLAERGPDRLTVAEVARRAEISPPMIHHYFTNRQGLLDALAAPGDPEPVSGTHPGPLAA